MASKEGLVIILDVSQNAKTSVNGEISFFEKEKFCCTAVLQNKIFSCKKDEVAIILMGTKNTENNLSNLGGYSNIIEAVPMQIPDWNMLSTLANPLNEIETISKGADWLDSLIVAMDVLQREDGKKLKFLKVVLFHNFVSSVDDSNVEIVINGLQKLDVDLVVISDSVQYKDDEELLKTISQFSASSMKSIEQNKSELLITQIIKSCNGKLSNFDRATQNITNQPRPIARPWYSKLDIGTKISIQVSCTILTEEVKHFKWRTESVYPEGNVFRATEYFKNGEKFTPNTAEELIKAYMLGSTPISYDNSLGVQEIPTEKGMKCIGFTHKSNVSEEYFCGKGTHLLLPKFGTQKSEKMFNALTLAMSKSDLVMICRRVYNDRNKPKFNVLIPNFNYSIPCFTMFQLYCSEQHIHREFPALRQRKTNPTPEQYTAIENLIDSMNLNDNSNVENTPRSDYDKELIPLKNLPNLTYNYIAQIATERALESTKNLTTSIRGKDTGITVPEDILQKSEEPLKQIKELFKLEEIKKKGKRELIRHLGDIPTEGNGDDNDVIDQIPLEYKLFGTIGTIHPAHDFKMLIDRDVEKEQNQETKKTNFDSWSYEMRMVLSDLIFKSVTQPIDKISEALIIYREKAEIYNPIKYNEWITEMKEIIINRKMFNFWEEVIVNNILGLIRLDDNIQEIQKFYNIEKTVQTMPLEDDNGNIDDLFGEM